MEGHEEVEIKSDGDRDGEVYRDGEREGQKEQSSQEVNVRKMTTFVPPLRGNLFLFFAKLQIKCVFFVFFFIQIVIFAILDFSGC